MTWNIASECISVVILCIIWVYARKGNPLPTIRNKLFQLCFLTTLCAMTSNIASTIMIYNFKSVPMFLTWVVTTIYFVSTPLMGVIYYFYAASVVGSSEKHIKNMILYGSIPAIIYILFVLGNPFDKLIFDINPLNGYVRGKYIIFTYIVFYIYCFMCVIISQFSRSKHNISEKRILSVFPIFAVVVIIIQQLFPEYILSGSAATCALLIIYLYLENKQISIDYLTGLPNREVFLQMLQLKTKKRKADSFVVIVLSLKGFKQINKNLGQQNGNLYLQQVAAFLKESVSAHMLYRFSGDEFAILVENISEEEIEELIHSLLSRMSSPWIIGNYSSVLSAAIGVVKYQNDMNNAEAIINGIEYAVASAKKSPVSSCTYCTPEMMEKANRKEEIIEILRDRIKNNTLEVYFQPIWGIKEEQFIVAESLSRLTNTSLGTVSPDEFIAVAEDSGLIIPMTYQILDKICKFIRSILDCGSDLSGVSINLSAVQFSDEGFSKKFLDIITANNIPPSKIKIEITESVLISNFDGIQYFMIDMHSLGVVFGLDDFGTGYSNLTSVLKLPWDTIKLDKSLIWSASKNEKSGILVKHIIDAFSSIGIRLLAEGVETEVQDRFVKENGFNMIQGFLYARPTPPLEAQAVFCNQPLIEFDSSLF